MTVGGTVQAKTQPVDLFFYKMLVQAGIRICCRGRLLRSFSGLKRIKYRYFRGSVRTGGEPIKMFHNVPNFRRGVGVSYLKIIFSETVMPSSESCTR